MLGGVVKSVKVVAVKRNRYMEFRVTIPSELAKTLSIKPGDTLLVRIVELEINGNKVKALAYYKP
jgi:bifunctional DNA-binding transcriptional regulator/antitoxin component of YhaV-PrlF toxin-antitoxin module